MRSLPDATFDVLYADPPFFTGQPRRFRGGAGAAGIGFEDARTGGLESYAIWLNARLFEMRRLLRPSGSLFVHLDGHAVHQVKCELDRLFGPDQFQADIAWCYETGGAGSRHFPRKHDSILHYGRSRRIEFHPQRIRKYLKHQMRRRGVPEFFDPARRQWYRYKLCPDWWVDVDTVRADSRERVGWPTEKPPALIERILLSTTVEGAVVGDFFSGGGVTPLVAQRLSRRWVACDLSPIAAGLAAARLERDPGSAVEAIGFSHEVWEPSHPASD